LPKTDQCFSILAAGTPSAAKRAEPFGVVGMIVRAGLRIEEADVMTGAAFLLAIWKSEGIIEGARVRP